MFTAVLVTMAFIIFLFYQWRSTTKLPPGPYPIFVLGNMPQILYYAWRYGGIVSALQEIKKRYGKVFTLWLGPLPTVHIADFTLSYEAMVRYGAKYQDRWSPAIMLEGRGDRGLIVSSGELWQEQRRFSLHTLRNLGLSGNLVEERIMEEFNRRFDEIDQLPSNSTIDPFVLFGHLVGGVINRMLFGEPVDESEEVRFYELKRRLDAFVETMSIEQIFIKKWMLSVPFINLKWKNQLAPIHEMKAFFRNQVESRQKAINDGSHSLDAEPRDYTDAFLLRMKEDCKNGVKYSSFDNESLIVNIMDLWIAGQETTSTTILWGLIYLLRNPEVVNNVRKELLKVTGGSRSLSLSDKSETPYFLATIAEIQRHASILNMNLWRLSDTEDNIGGYHIPKNTVVSAELCLILSDETKFSSPHEFDPSRFLSEPSLLSSVIPFGIGRRACLGESLARAELYLIIGNLLLRYAIQSIDEKPSTDVINKFGIMKKPKPYKIKITKIV